MDKKLYAGFYNGKVVEFPISKWARIHSAQAKRNVRGSELTRRTEYDWTDFDAVSRFFGESAEDYTKRVPMASKNITSVSSKEELEALFLTKLKPPLFTLINGLRHYA